MAAPSRKDLSNAIRALSMDAVQKANSGHPGMPMGMADIAQVLWCDFLKHDPKNPNWLNRDRFVLSNGHGSMLLYSMLHLTGYNLSISDIKNFRQINSKTPGHPEYGYTEGVETTTGPLGQGIANAVGMAIGERVLASSYNTDKHNLIDHFTYAFCGDGCLMEGVSHEVCSLAGTLKLGKLILIWDDNGISIDGKVDGWFTEDIAKRFESYGWHVVSDVDGHSPEQISDAIKQAKNNLDQPSIICARTIIGYGSPNKADTAGSHGAALGEDEISLTREKLGWSHAPFEIPEDIYSAYSAIESGRENYNNWQDLWESYKQENPDKANELSRRLSKEMPDNWVNINRDWFESLANNPQKMATRKASQQALKHFAKLLPDFLGGSADLTGSNNTNWGTEVALTNKKAHGNYCFYGVREFGMAAIMNGLSLYGGFIPYGGTFLVFSDYMRNAMRMSALMKQRVIYVLTHDSIGLGEDGPTHQPIEHKSSLRLIPNMHVWRPCDDLETAVSWECAIERTDGPTSLCLSRQGLESMQDIWNKTNKDISRYDSISKGGYVLFETNPGEDLDLIVLSTGSEVSLVKDAVMSFIESNKSVNIRVVSMPCIELFLSQSEDYRNSVLPKGIKKLAVEAGSSVNWYRFIGDNGAVMGIDSFGESAPAHHVFEHFGITLPEVKAKISSMV